jgi:hypothetical protein
MPEPAVKSAHSPANTLAGTRWLDALAIATLVVVGALAAFTFRDYGLGWDDYTHSQYGDLLVSLYASGLADKRALSFVNLYMYGGGFDLLAALTAKVLCYSTCSRRDGSWVLLSASLAFSLPGGWDAASAARSPG